MGEAQKLSPEEQIRFAREGFDGGQEMRDSLDSFFTALRERARPWTAVG